MTKDLYNGYKGDEIYDLYERKALKLNGQSWALCFLIKDWIKERQYSSQKKNSR